MDNSFKSRYLEFIHKYNQLMQEYEELLSDSETNEHYPLVPPFFPFHERTIHIERKCALEKDSGKYLEMLTLPGQRTSALKEIRDFTIGTKSLIIVDPYIFSGLSENAKKITDEFKEAIRAKGKDLKHVHFVYDSEASNTTNAIRNSIKKMLKDESIQITESQSNVLHDRIWIADRNRAVVVGTSLNGIGGRVAFILQLPNEDLNALLKYLDENNLSRSRS